MGKRFSKVWGKDANQHVGCPSRVGQRAKDVEDGALTQFTARPNGMTHGGVMLDRIEKTNARFIDTFGNLLSRQI